MVNSWALLSEIRRLKKRIDLQQIEQQIDLQQIELQQMTIFYRDNMV